MVWRATDPQCNEARKCVWAVAQYLRGRGLDLGAGDFRILPHAVTVDNMHHAQFGFKQRPDILSDVSKLDMIASQSQDWVFSSHTLEHVPYEEVPKTLREWVRVTRPGGYVILYLPDEDEYPRVGQEGANPDHRWNVNYERVVEAMETIGRGWDLIEFEKRNEDQEYSLLFIFKVQ